MLKRTAMNPKIFMSCEWISWAGHASPKPKSGSFAWKVDRRVTAPSSVYLVSTRSSCHFILLWCPKKSYGYIPSKAVKNDQKRWFRKFLGPFFLTNKQLLPRLTREGCRRNGRTPQKSPRTCHVFWSFCPSVSQKEKKKKRIITFSVFRRF